MGLSNAFIREAKATFKPTCFIKQAAFLPIDAAPKATSRAHFSLVDHSVWTSLFSMRLKSTIPGRISELGVPG